MTYDLAIVGAGVAGVAAAIEAAHAGVEVVLIEASPEPGGAGMTGSALTCVVDSPLQRAHGIGDSVELALGDWIAWGGEEADASWARIYLERSAREVYGWLARLGIQWDSVIATEGNTVPRQHQPRGGGAKVMGTLLSVAAALPIDWRLSTTAVDLSWDDHRVTGVLVESQDTRETIAAQAVLLATGGFANSKPMLARFGPKVPEGGRLLRGGAEGALGRGHDLLAGTGAEFVGLDRVWTYAYGVVDPADPASERGLAFWLTNDVWVNAEGRRFHDESLRGGASATPALLRQTRATCWSIFDAAEAERIEIPHPRYRRDDGSTDRAAIRDLLASSEWIHSATTFAELALAAGLPAGTIAETMSEVQLWGRGGQGFEPRFGRPVTGFRPISNPPFYAVQFFPLARKCLGGVRTDPCGRVLRHGRSIEGLYAAGELAGMAGGRLNGRAALEGTMFGPSLLSGRIAARAVAGALAVSRPRDPAGR